MTRIDNGRRVDLHRAGQIGEPLPTRIASRSIVCRLWLLLLLLSLSGCDVVDGLVGSADHEDYEPAAVLLTWRQDPTSTMVVDWHSEGGDNGRQSLRFRRAGRFFWVAARPADIIEFPFSDRTIHRVELMKLEPGSDYEFRIGRHGRTYRFRTMPASLTRPVRFLVGGDMLGRGLAEAMERTARVGMAYDPDFVVVAGDLAYADGRPDRVERWYTYLNAYRRSLITDDDRLVPMVHSVGNHEVADGYWFNHEHYDPSDIVRATIAPYFFRVLAFPGQPGYGVLDVGDYLSIVVLDSDHTGPVVGAQAEWLEQIMSERADRPHVFPVYHLPAYPSVRPYDAVVSSRIRDHWVPIFERYGVGVVFEAHDHAYKRTRPIRGNSVDPSGIVYLGDGAWGVDPREIGGEQPVGYEAWYIERAESVRHLIVATITSGGGSFHTVSDEGVVIDHFQTARR